MTETSLKERVQARLDALGLNPFEADRRAGFKRGFVYDIIGGKKQSVRGTSLVALAEVLDCDLPYLAGQQSEPRLFDASQPGGGRLVPVTGIIESGAFRDPELAEDVEDQPVTADLRFPPSAQRAFRVADDALNRRGLDRGAIALVATVDAWKEKAGRIRDGLVVVLRRSRDETEELAARILREFEDRTELQADSTNPRYRTYTLDDDTEIVGVVLAATRALAPDL